MQRERRAGLVRIGSGLKDAKPYQLVLTDMHMPEMDGFGLVEEIRRNPELSPLTVVMLTSAGHPGDAEHCRKLGISSYLYKPVRKRELLAAILTALGHAQTASPAVGRSTNWAAAGT